jgi:aspartyl-tRNA(Asn)/glutamyl-tRNA(Gln) amidotransferase subunit A
LRVGIPKEYFGEGIDSRVKELVEKAVKNFEKIGAKITETTLPLTEYSLAVYYIIMPAEASTNLARYDGVKYGYSASSEQLLDNYLKTRAQGFGSEVRRRIMLGTYVLSAGYYESFYGKAQRIRELIKKEFEKVFSPSASGFDILLTPTSPTTAFKIGEKTDPLSMYLSDIYTIPANLAGLPAISIPCGKIDNLPAGLQIIGPQFKDDLVLEVAQMYQQVA